MSATPPTHEINNWDLAILLLNDPSKMSADRSEFFFPLFQLLTSDPLALLRTQYSEWLMYSDGTQHAHARQCVTRLLKSTHRMTISSALTALENSFPDGIEEIKPNEIASVAEEIHRTMLGSPIDSYKSAYLKAKRIRDFFVYLDLPNLDHRTLTDDLCALNASISSSANGDQLKALTLEVGGTGAAVNLMGDTLNPLTHVLVCATRYCLTMPKDELFSLPNIVIRERILAGNPPFPHVNRRAACGIVSDGLNIRAGERVSFSIGSLIGAPNGKVPLFGIGPHTCPGASLVNKATDLLINRLRRVRANAASSDVKFECLELMRSGEYST